MTGWDFDGVLTTGRYHPEFDDVIITGNTRGMFPHVIKEMRRLNIACPVYFNPYDWAANNNEAVALWKVEMITKLQCEYFYEDDPVQFQIIKQCCPKTMIIKV